MHHSFFTFLCSHCTITTWNSLILRFVEGMNVRQRFSFLFINLDTVFNEWILEKNRQHLKNENSGSKSDEVWNSSHSLFWWRLSLPLLSRLLLAFFLFVCLLLAIFLSFVGDWHKFYGYYFFASYLHGKLVSILCYRMLGMERSLFSPVMTTTMIQKAKI